MFPLLSVTKMYVFKSEASRIILADEIMERGEGRGGSVVVLCGFFMGLRGA